MEINRGIPYFCFRSKIGVRLADDGRLVLSPYFQVVPKREVDLKTHRRQEATNGDQKKMRKKKKRIRPDDEDADPDGHSEVRKRVAKNTGLHRTR